MALVQLLSRTARRVALWLSVTVAGALAGNFFISWADELGWYKRPNERVADAVSLLSSLSRNEWFHWVGGCAIGFWIGARLDATLNRGSPQLDDTAETATIPPKNRTFVRTILRVKFSGDLEVPRSIHEENIRDWYIYWSPPLTINDQEGNIYFERPASWVLFINFLEPTHYHQVAVNFSGGRPQSYEIKRSLTTSVVITIEGNLPACEMEAALYWKPTPPP